VRELARSLSWRARAPAASAPCLAQDDTKPRELLLARGSA
jgi:hypothetical protein